MPVYFWTEYEIITNYGTLKSKHKRQKIKIGKHAHTQKKIQNRSKIHKPQ